MKYIIIDTQKAYNVGILSPHRLNNEGTKMIINENDLKNCPAIIGQTIEEKAENIGGEVYSLPELNNLINEGGWQ